jgi:hypothetical protein
MKTLPIQLMNFMARRPWLGAVLIVSLCSTYVRATSVESVDMGEMLQASGLVFEGKVIEVESSAAQTDAWKIHTYVTFEVIDLIKGSLDSKTITLSFLGGTVGDRSINVGGMQVPRKGEHGIYFVEVPDRVQVHPLYGWSQGHFLCEKDAGGVVRILTSRRKPIYGIEMKPSVEVKGLGDGIARGLTLQKQAVDRSGVSVEEFKSILKGALDNAQ